MEVEVRERFGLFPVSAAARLLRVRQATLRGWAGKHLVGPELEAPRGSQQVVAAYDFEQLLRARLIAMLRERGVSLRNAAFTLQHLLTRFGAASEWGDFRLGVHRRHPYIFTDDIWMVVRPHNLEGAAQRVEPEVLFGDYFEALGERIDALLIPPRYREYIEMRPEARDGFPVVRHSAIETALIHQLTTAGLPLAQVAEYYPHLPPEAIRQADAFENELDRAA